MAAELDDIFAGKIADDPEPDVEEPAAEAEPDAPAEDDAPDGTEMTAAEERLYAGRFKTVEELERGWEEANRLISSGAHKQPPAPEPEAEVEAEPQFILPLGGEPLTSAELEQWATDAPAEAGKWALAQPGLNAQLRAAVIKYWRDNDPEDYDEFQFQRRFEPIKQQLAETLAPQQQFMQQQQQAALKTTLETQIADWADIGPEILQHVAQNPQAIPPHVWQGGFGAVASFLDQFYGNAIRFQRYQAQVAAQQQAAPPAASQPARGSRAVTQTSSGAAAPSAGGQHSVDDIKAGIVAGIREAAGGGITLG